MKSIKDLVEQRSNSPNSKKYLAARRKLAISDIEKLVNKKDIWRWFSFPIYIPTEWIESWKEPLILHYGNKRDKLFELLKESRT